jgi:putative pyruvate formate lyase activating enzyme
VDERGVATRGLLVRHLVLPDGLAGTTATARFLAEEISRDTYINVMDQYRPAFRATREEFEPFCAGICRPPSGAEQETAMAAVKAAGLWRLEGVDLP